MRNDTDFGEITFRAEYGYYEWLGENHIPGLGKEDTQIVIESDQNQTIAQQQREVYRLLLADRSGIQATIKHRIFEYYQDLRKRLLPIYDTEIAEEYLPAIQEVSQVNRLINQPSLHLYQPKTEKVIFSLAYECLWDEEHGMGIRIEDWQVTNIGLYDAMWG